MRKNKFLSMMLSFLLTITGIPIGTSSSFAETTSGDSTLTLGQKITHKAKLMETDNPNLCLRNVEGEVTLKWPLKERPIDLVIIQDTSGSFEGLSQFLRKAQEYKSIIEKTNNIADLKAKMKNSTASFNLGSFSYNFTELEMVGAIRPEAANDIKNIKKELEDLETEIQSYTEDRLAEAKSKVLAVTEKILKLNDSQIEDRTGKLTDTLKKIADNLGNNDRVMFTRYGGYLGTEDYASKGFDSPLDASKIPTALEALTSVPQSLTNNKESFKKAVEEALEKPEGATPTPLGLKRALDEYLNATNRIISKEDDKDRLKIFMLITDGISNVRLDGKLWYDLNHVSRYSSIAELESTGRGEAVAYHEGSMLDVEQVAREITKTRPNASGEDENYILSTVYWKNDQTVNFRNKMKFKGTPTLIDDTTARAMFELMAGEATESLKNLTTKLAGENQPSLHISSENLEEVVARIYENIRKVQQPPTDKIELVLDKGYKVRNLSEITLESVDLTDAQTTAIQNLMNENKVTNVTLKDGKIQIQPLLQKTDDGKYDKVVFPMVNMPKVDFTIKYKLKESQFHDEESEVFTGIASSYDVSFPFGQDSKIPANTNKDVCELNPVDDITRHRVVKRVEDINIKTTSMEYEKQTQVDDVAKNIFQKELSALDTANEEFKYTVEYHMGTGISHKEDVRIVDDINENVQILEVKLKGYDPVEKIEKETVIQPNDNKIEYVFEKYQDSNDAIKSYDYLEGKSYTLTIRAKIKNDVSSNQDLLDKITPIKNVAKLVLTPKPPIPTTDNPNPPAPPVEEYPSNETKVIPPPPIKDSEIYKRVFDSDEKNSVANTLYNEDEYSYEATYYLRTGLKDSYSIQLEDEINAGLKVTKVEVEGNHLGQGKSTVVFENDTLKRVYNETSNKVAYRFPKVNGSYEYIENQEFKLRIYVKYINSDYATKKDNGDMVIENTAYLVTVPQNPNDPNTPPPTDPNNPVNPDNPDPYNPNTPDNPDPSNPPTPVVPDPNVPPTTNTPKPYIPSNPTETKIIPPPPPVTTDVMLKIKATKQWQDEDGNNISDELAKAYSVTVGLFKNDEQEPIETKLITGNSEVTFKDVNAYDENKSKIVYTLKEISLSEGYSPADEGKIVKDERVVGEEQQEYVLHFINRKNTPSKPVPPKPEPPVPNPPTPEPPKPEPYVPTGGGGGGGRRDNNPPDPKPEPPKPETPKPEPPKPETPVTPNTPPTTPNTPDLPPAPPVPNNPEPKIIIPNETPKDTPKEGEIPKRPDGTPSIKTPPTNGTVIVDGNGKWKYTPNKGYVGKDRFVVEVTYPDGTTEEVIVELDVEEPPLAAVPPEGEMTLPKTGYENDYYTILGMLAIAAAYLISRRKKDDK